MRNAIAYRAVFVVIALQLSCPAIATVEVVEAHGNLENWVLYNGRHSPCSIARWSHSPEDGPVFDLRGAGFEGCVTSDWHGQCDGNGFMFSGEMLPATDGRLGWWVYLQSEISVLLELNSPTRVSAVRSVEGMFSRSIHTVSLTLPDGTVDVLLGSDEDVNHAERLIGAGTCRIKFSILADDIWYLPFAYTGFVAVNWDSPVASVPLTWGGLKSQYR